jgi:hypothetical protein
MRSQLTCFGPPMFELDDHERNAVLLRDRFVEIHVLELHGGVVNNDASEGGECER